MNSGTGQSLHFQNCLDRLAATEKLDGTCCLVQNFRGRPWLWARHDVKPNKTADKRFKEYQRIKYEQQLSENNREPLQPFLWNLEEDFKEKPDDWIPAATGEILHLALAVIIYKNSPLIFIITLFQCLTVKSIPYHTTSTYTNFNSLTIYSYPILSICC